MSVGLAGRGAVLGDRTGLMCGGHPAWAGREPPKSPFCVTSGILLIEVGKHYKERHIQFILVS